MALQPHAPADPETAYRLAHLAGFGDHAADFAAYALGLPPFSEGTPMGWTMPMIRRLRFLRWRVERGDLDGDRFGLTPEPLPPIVRPIPIVMRVDGNEPRDGMWR